MKHFQIVFILAAFLSKSQPTDYIAKYSFNNGTTKDESGRNDAKAIGVLFVEDRFGNRKSSCYLHGAPGSYINLGTDTALKPYKGSISLWLNIELEANGGIGYEINPIILAKNGVLNEKNRNDDFFEGYALVYDLNSKKINATASQSEELQVPAHSHNILSLREWHHIVMTYDDDSLHLYIDGASEAKLSKNFRSVFSKTDSVMIGNSANLKNQRFLNGMVDDILIFNRVITPGEVLSLYKAPDPDRFNAYLKWAFRALLLAAFMYLLLWLIMRKQKKKFEKEKEAQRLIADYRLIALKAQMNPHFMSNSLSSVQNLIYSGDIDKAGEYIAMFSVFLREVLEYSDKHFLALEKEINIIKLYVELEQLRFKNNFNFRLEVEESLPVTEVLVPALITQPFIENAIWHGLLPLKEKPMELRIRIYSKNTLTYFEIEDNGVGRNCSRATHNKKSKGVKLATDKIESINQLLNSSDNRLEILDLVGEDGQSFGTRVIIQLSHYSFDE